MKHFRPERAGKAARLIAAAAALCCLLFVCALAEEDISLFSWRVREDNTACITGWNSDGDTVVIPETIEGHAVTEIGDGAFRNHTALKNVTMPDTLQRIGEEAFDGCSSYRWVKIPLSVREIGARAFRDCALNVFAPPRRVTYIGEDALADTNVRYINVIRFTYTEEWVNGLKNMSPNVSIVVLDIARMKFSQTLAAQGDRITCTAVPSAAGIESFQWQRSFDGESWTDCWESSEEQECFFTASAATSGCWYRVLAVDSAGRYPTEPVYIGYLDHCPEPDVRACGTTISVDWESIGDEVAYTLYMTGPDGRETVLADNTAFTYADLTGLEEDAAYSFRLKASFGTWSAYSSLVTVRTGQERTGTVCRALLIGEVNYRNPFDQTIDSIGDLKLIGEMLKTVTDPDGNPYSIVRKVDLTKDEIRRAIRDTFAGADGDDISLFFIATHGKNGPEDDPEESGSLTAFNPATGEDEFISDKELAAWLAAVPGKKIVFLEACSSGSFIYNADEQARFGRPRPDGALRRDGFHVLTSSAHMEDSYAYDTGEPLHTLFTYGLTRGIGLSGAMPCDTNGDGLASANELIAWIRNYRDPYLPGERQHSQMYPARSDDPLFRRLGAAPEPDPMPDTESDPDLVPKTGDDAPLAVWMLCILAGACGLILLYRKSRRKSS